jgi:uncharacterized damage-inducible protein DinB
MNRVEVWLRGSLENISPTLTPVAHALLQASEDVELASSLTFEQLWLKPGGAASVGFHLRHIVGSIDRLLTYAKGQQLEQSQLDFLHSESESTGNAAQLVKETREATTRAVQTLLETDETTLFEARSVGRKNLPSTIIGLLYHIGEHSSRHTGQIITTVKIIQGLNLPVKKDGMQYFEVDSSMIGGFGYDAEKEILELDFINKGRYRYFDVPYEVFEQLRDSHSKGSYIRDLIIDQYPTEKVRSRTKGS